MGTFQYKVISQSVILSGNSVSSIINLNTLFGLVIALAILIFIILLIYFIKIKPYLDDNTAGKTIKSISTVDHVIAQIVEHEEKELSGDYELVAVITAAIYASLGDSVPTDGLIVRSIRKVSSKRWMNA
ncbi:MAG: OadG family transporter subunit [Mobilitalea sp.]